MFESSHSGLLIGYRQVQWIEVIIVQHESVLIRFTLRQLFVILEKKNTYLYGVQKINTNLFNIHKV